MDVQRIFLGTDGPGLAKAVDYLVENYASDRWLDLQTFTLVTPGARASRRLQELLYQRVQSDKLRFFPPQIDTIGSIPESLYESRLPFASEWVQQLTWARAVREVPADTRRQVFPRTPTDPNQYSESEWLALGRMLQGTYRELAAESLSFDDVAKAGENMDSFPEQERWNAMADIQDTYLSFLRQRQLWDRQTARLRAISGNECATGRRIILIGTADIRRALREMLEQVANRVTALVPAPAEWSDRFDALGCVIPSAWENTVIDFSKATIDFVGTFSQQAACVTQQLAEHEDRYACNEITIGCPDDRIVPHLTRSFAAHDINSREVKGHGIAESPIYRFLVAIREAIFSGSFESYASLGRHPDTFEWLNGQVSREWLQQADDYRTTHLPTKATNPWLGSKDRYKDLISAFHLLGGLLAPLLGGQVRPMREWSTPIAKLLKSIYRTKTWHRNEPEDHIAIGAFQAINRFLSELGALPPEVSPLLNAAEALELMLEELEEHHISPPADADAIEMLGWLELPLDDAPVLVITGLTEGIVPTSTTADLFLPNTLRKHLRIADNERRYARDAYALSTIMACRNATHIVVAKVDDEGEPLRPSRLLFAQSDDDVVKRWQDFFETGSAPILIDPPDASIQTNATPEFGFEVPLPRQDSPHPTSISPTAFRTYIACPYRFYLQKILGIRKRETEAAEMTGGLFGDVAHTVLEKFGECDDRDSEDPRVIAEVLKQILSQESKRRFGTRPKAAVRIQLRQLELRLDQFAKEQAKSAREGWRIRHTELSSADLEKPPVVWTPDETRSLTLNGKIDRIDFNEVSNKYRILDYKTSDSNNPPEKNHRKKNGGAMEWIDLQLPLYRQIAFAAMPEIEDINELNDVGYVRLSKKQKEIDISPAKWTPQDFAEADSLASQIVERIFNREFWPPQEVKYDDYESILMTTVSERPPLEA